MKLGIKAFLFGLSLPALAFLPTLARAGSAAGPLTLTASEVSVKIVGSSTLHGWEASAASVSVTALLGASTDSLTDSVRQGGLVGLDMVLGVDSLKTTESSGMDKNMHHDLESDKFPEIRFSLRSYAVAGLTVTAQGDLNIHGTTKPVTLTGLLVPKNGALSLSGGASLLMSDYGVKPPVMMFGTVKVADQVKIVYGFKLSE
jgi:polyisoprenoid-binding protein YceI